MFGETKDLKCKNLYAEGTIQATKGAVIAKTVNCDTLSIGGHKLTAEEMRKLLELIK